MDTIKYGDIILASSADRVSDYRESGEEVVQVQRPMRGAVAKTVRRGGALTTITLTVARTHQSHVEARAHIRRTRREILEEEATTVDYEVSGAGSSEGKLIDAHVQMVEGRAYGIRSFISYRIQGAENLPE